MSTITKKELIDRIAESTDSAAVRDITNVMESHKTTELPAYLPARNATGGVSVSNHGPVASDKTTDFAVALHLTGGIAAKLISIAPESMQYDQPHH